MPMGSKAGETAVVFANCREKIAGLFTINGQKAWDAGLVNRPLAETIKDVSVFETSLEAVVSIGLKREEEARIFEDWKW
jgi:hypothetical protein